MNLRELEVQAKAFAPVLKGLVDRAFEGFRAELAKDLAERDVQLQASTEETLLAAKPDLEVIARAAAALVEPGKDGAGVDPDELQRLIAEEVAKLPTPADGASVTVDDVRPMIDEQVAAAIGQLPPAKDGKDGQDVTPDQIQLLVDEAVAQAIAQIVLPSDGEPGRDALDLEILPEIDETKSYARGSYAKHLGGLWRSFERTTGMKGWECIVEGVAALKIEQDGERGIKAVAQLSSGAIEEASLIIESMIYRGVYTPSAYAKGDTVTWGGSLWHCDEQTSDKPGEPGSKGWRLAVKKGRDGRDGTNGKDLTKGVSLP